MGSCNRSFIEIHNVQSHFTLISNKVEKIGIFLTCFPIECQSESQAQVLFGAKTWLGLNRMLTSCSHNKTMHLLEFPNYIEVTITGCSVHNNTTKWKANKVALVTLQSKWALIQVGPIYAGLSKSQLINLFLLHRDFSKKWCGKNRTRCTEVVSI